jgi:hypothetical protein
VYATYRRRRCAHEEQNVTYTPEAFPGYGPRGLAYNTIVDGLADVLAAHHAADQGGEPTPPRNMKMLSQRLSPAEVKNRSIANVPPSQLHGVETLVRWRWELYDVDVQPPSWNYGLVGDDEFPFGLSALDVEVVERLQEKADRNAYDGASDVRLDEGGGHDSPVSRSWFGPADDAIVVAFASKNTRPTTAVRLLRITPSRMGIYSKDGSIAYNEKVPNRTLVENHDPIDPPKDPADLTYEMYLSADRANVPLRNDDFEAPSLQNAARAKIERAQRE